MDRSWSSIVARLSNDARSARKRAIISSSPIRRSLGSARRSRPQASEARAHASRSPNAKRGLFMEKSLLRAQRRVNPRGLPPRAEREEQRSRDAHGERRPQERARPGRLPDERAHDRRREDRER